MIFSLGSKYNHNYILFSKNYFRPLSSNITKASIMITMEEKYGYSF